MIGDGTIEPKHVSTFLGECRKTSASAGVVLDLTDVDRVEFGTLGEFLVASADLALRKVRLRLIMPSHVVLPREKARLSAGRAPTASKEEVWARTSARRRYERRQDLRKQLVTNGFLGALRDIYIIAGFHDGLEVEREPRDLLLGSADASIVPFRWISLPKPSPTSRSDILAGLPLSTVALAKLISSGSREIDSATARRLSEFIARELASNVIDHAYPVGFDGPRVMLVGGIALSAKDVDRAYGAKGEQCYVLPRVAGGARQALQLVVADTGVTIPVTLPLTPSDERRLEEWAGEGSAANTPAAKSLLYSFHPLSSSRIGQGAGQPIHRGLSYITRFASIHGGHVYAHSGTAVARLDLTGSRREMKSTRGTALPGTLLSVTVVSQGLRAELPALAPARLRAAKIHLAVLAGDDSAEQLAHVMSLQESAGGSDVVAIATEPRYEDSPDREILSQLVAIDGAMGAWRSQKPWLALVPFTADEVLGNLVVEDDLGQDIVAQDAEQAAGRTGQSAAEADASERAGIDQPVLVFTIDSKFVWIGGTSAQRRQIRQSTGIGEALNVVSLDPDPEVAPLGPWMQSGRFGSLDLSDGIYAAALGLLNREMKRIEDLTPDSKHKVDVLLNSLKTSRHFIDLADVLRRRSLNTVAAVAVSLCASRKLHEGSSIRYVALSRDLPILSKILKCVEGDAVSKHVREGAKIVAVAGVAATQNTLRSQLSLLIKEGDGPDLVCLVLSAAAEPPSVIRTVFREIPLDVLVARDWLRDPEPGDRDPLDDVRRRLADLVSVGNQFGILESFMRAHPEAVKTGHFVRRRGRHMSTFVDVGPLFTSAEPDVASKLSTLGEHVLELFRVWWNSVDRVETITVAIPADDSRGAAWAFAQWVTAILQRETDVDFVPVRLDRNLVVPAEPSDLGATMLLDWGAVTGESLQKMQMNLALMGSSSIFTLCLTSQLDAEQELLASSVGVLSLPANSEEWVPLQTRFLSHLELTHRLEHTCDLCRVRGELGKLSENPHVPEMLRHRAQHRAEELKPAKVDLSGGTGEPNALLLSSAGPDLVLLREVLREASIRVPAKLALLKDLRALASQWRLSPLNTKALAWAQMIAVEPALMAGSEIDLEVFRDALSGLFERVLLESGAPEPDLPEALRVYLIGLRIASKDRFLRILPRIAADPDKYDLLVEALLLVAAFLERPYHQFSANALELMAEVLEQVGAQLEQQSEDTTVARDLRSTLQVLERLVALYIHRREPESLSDQEAWRRLKSTYVSPLLVHRGLPGDVVTLALNVSPSPRSHVRFVDEVDPLQLAKQVAGLAEAWEPAAQTLSSRVLPFLPRIEPILLELLQLRAVSAPEAVEGLFDLDLWHGRLLAMTPTCFSDVEELLRRLESSDSEDRGRALKDLHTYWQWLLHAVFSPRQTSTSEAGAYRAAALFEVLSSAPVSIADRLPGLLRDAARRVGLMDAILHVEEPVADSVFVSSYVVSRVLELTLENALGHRDSRGDVGVRVQVRVFGSGDGNVHIAVLNTQSDPEIRATASRKQGLLYARYLVELFGGRLTSSPMDGFGPDGWTYRVDITVSAWAPEEISGE